ncbi:MAG: helix-turn-helix domain-containing protein, partial [Nitrospirae bacterium]|nr:helix-turn-helix domain-containing protein [Nitrospirota bacterium]
MSNENFNIDILKDYYKASIHIFDIDDIDIYEMNIMHYMTSLRGCKTIYASHATIAKKCKMSSRKARSAIESLEKKKYLLVKHNKADGENNNYRVSRNFKRKLALLGSISKTQVGTVCLPPRHDMPTPPRHTVPTKIISIYNHKKKEDYQGKETEKATEKEKA